MKSLLTLILTIFTALIINAQEMELPFFDGFEETPGDIGIFTKWTSENLEGANFWHIIDWYGNPGHSMRFVKSEFKENDWLITKPINCTGANQIKVSFDHLYTGTGKKPKFYYTKNYNEKSAESTWIEVNYTLGENENEWIYFEEVIIENPGDTLYFAFHYQAAANEGTVFLFDNFSVKSYIPPIPLELVGTSEHFEFYSEADNANYWDSISPNVDNWYKELGSYWNRPGTDSIFKSEDKIKIYLVDKSTFNNEVGTNLPAWKLGGYKIPNEIYVTIPTEEEENIYEGSFKALVKNTFGQLALKKQSLILHGGYLPDYLSESFGLYYSGYRPNRGSLVTLINDLGRSPVISDIEHIYDISILDNKDLIVSYIEAQILKDSYQNIYWGKEELWQVSLIYYYKIEEDKRMGLWKSSSNFDIYCIPRDTIFINLMSEKLEELLIQYKTPFDLTISHRFNVVIFPDLETAKEFNGGKYSMGSSPGGDNFNILSPLTAENPMEAASGGLIDHEFAHVIHFLMTPYSFFPNYKFIMEGFADFYRDGTIDMRSVLDLWKVEEVFYWYNNDFGRDPILKDIMENPQTIEPYLFGQIFYNFLIPEVASYNELKNFFYGRCDWTAFNMSYGDIDKGYIKYLKSLVNYIPQDILIEIPFDEPFDNFLNGWTKPSYKNPDNWQICDDGLNGGNCARFYTNSDKNTSIKSWLITPPLNTQNMGKVVFSFDYHRYGEGSELEVFYTGKFDGDTEKSNWKSIQKISMTDALNWKNSGEITLLAPPDTLFLGIRYSSPGEQHQQAYIDNFIVKDRATAVDEVAFVDYDFKIYPNPVTSESIISFETKTNGNVNLSVYDIQGRKVCTLLDKKLSAGTHTIPLGNQIQTNGVYLCKLATSKGVSTLKLIVNK